MKQADIGLVGGDPMQRIVIACKLRRQGVSVHAELRNRKPAKAYQAARREAREVADLDTIEGQERICEFQR